MKYTKNSKLKSLTSSPLTLLARREAGGCTAGCKGWRPLLFTHLDRTCKRQDFLKKNHSTVLKASFSAFFKRQFFKVLPCKTFTASSLTLSARRDAGGTIGRCMLAEPSAVYSYDQSVQKTTFSWTKLSEISENVSSLNLPQSLRYNRLKLNFLFFLNANFSEYSRVEWVK